MVSAISLCLLALGLSAASSQLLSDPESTDAPISERRTFKHGKPVKILPFSKKHKKFAALVPLAFAKGPYEAPVVHHEVSKPFYKVHRYHGFEVKPVHHDVSFSTAEPFIETHSIEPPSGDFSPSFTPDHSFSDHGPYIYEKPSFPSPPPAPIFAPLPPSLPPSPPKPIFSFVPAPQPVFQSIPVAPPVFSQVSIPRPPAPVPVPVFPSHPLPPPAQVPVFPSQPLPPPAQVPVFPSQPLPPPAQVPVFPPQPLPPSQPVFSVIPVKIPAPVLPAPSPAPIFHHPAPALPSPTPLPALPAPSPTPIIVKIPPPVLPAVPAPSPAPILPSLPVVSATPAPILPSLPVVSATPAPVFPSIPVSLPPPQFSISAPAPSLPSFGSFPVSAAPEPEFPYPPSGTPIPSFIKDITLGDIDIKGPALPTIEPAKFEEVTPVIDDGSKNLDHVLGGIKNDPGFFQKIKGWKADKANAALSHFTHFMQKPIIQPALPVVHPPNKIPVENPTIQFPAPVSPLPLAPASAAVFPIFPAAQFFSPAKYENFPPNNIESPPLVNSYGLPIPHDSYAPPHVSHERLSSAASEEEPAVVPAPENKERPQQFPQKFQPQAIPHDHPVYVAEDNKTGKDDNKTIDDVQPETGNDATAEDAHSYPNHKE